MDTILIVWSENSKNFILKFMTKIRFELSKKHSKQEKEDQGLSGFIPAIARWMIERSNAWVERCKTLVKNHGRTLANATAK